MHRITLQEARSRILKKCTKCGEEKHLSKFKSDKRCRDGKQSACSECSYRLYDKPRFKSNKYREYQKKYRVKNRDKLNRQARNSYYKRNYGLTIDDFDKMYSIQNGKCYLCGIHQSKLKHTLAIDHCHKTGKI
ncbi:unnamed protein product, partial [marine sediment metagenome]